MRNDSVCERACRQLRHLLPLEDWVGLGVLRPWRRPPASQPSA